MSDKVVGLLLGKVKEVLVLLILALAVGWVVNPEAVSAIAHVAIDGLVGVVSQVNDSMLKICESIFPTCGGGHVDK